MPFRLTMLAQRAIYYLTKTPNTKHEDPAGQGSPEDSQNNIGFCHCPCLPLTGLREVLISEDMMHSDIGPGRSS